MAVFTRGVDCGDTMAESQSRSVVLAVTLLVVAAGVGASLAAGAASTGDAASERTDVAVADRSGPSADASAAADATATYRVEPAGDGQLRVTVAVTVPDDAETVTVGFAPSKFRFRSWGGFRSAFDGSFEAVDAADGDVATYRWTVDGDRGELTYTVDANVSNVFFEGLDAAATDEWALVPRRLVFPGRVTVDGEPLAPAAVTTEFGAYGDGYVGDGYAFFGPHERTSFDVEGGTVTVVVPEAVDRPGLDRIRRTVERTASRLGVGGRRPAVTAFVAPAGLRPGGRTVDSDFWVSAAPPADLPAHEYVHTRQPFVPGNGMRWFVEASAQYYGLRAAFATGDLSYRSFRSQLTDVDSGGTLTSPLRWEGGRTPYEKGALVLAALDAEIRRASDGTRTLQYVFARMNAHDGPVDEAQFREYVVEAAGKSLEDWLDRYVDGSRIPPLPADESLYTFVESGDADGDGLSDRREVVLGTGPEDPDTDGDGLPDGEDPDPLVPADTETTTVAPTTDAPPTAPSTTAVASPTTAATSPATSATDSTRRATTASGQSPGDTADATDAGTDAGDGGAPAPGPLAAVAAVLAGTWLAGRRRR